MRFLMLSWRDPKNPKGGGAERVSKAYLGELVRRGHEAFWFANDFPGGAREENVEGIKIVRGGGTGTSILKAIQWYRQQPKFDLVIDQHHGIPWYAPWWCGTNSIAYIHEVLGPTWQAFHSWPVSAIGESQERWTHWFYRKVPFWTPSESTKKRLLTNGVREVSVFPNGTDATPLPELEKKPLSLPLRLVTVCRLAPNKRVDHAIQAVKLLVTRGIATELTVVGNGESEGSLKQLVKELSLREQVVFTGPLDEPAKNAALRCAHFLVHTSVREGWGLNVIEANAMGTPAIVYPVDGLVDSTIHEETGLMVPVEEPEAIASCLAAAAKEPAKYETYRVNAWQRSKTFAWDKVLPSACDWLEAQARRRPQGSVT
jgi:glycosyltransferase involved in cell wall biosynthesis